MEETSADLQLWSGKKEEEVAAIAQGATVKKKQEYKPPTRQSQKRNCGKCGRQHEREKCPAYGKTCFKCQKLNHYASCCKSKEDAQVVDADSDRDSVLHIEVEKVGKKLLAKVKVNTNKQARELTCQIDTAASCNVLARRD